MDSRNINNEICRSFLDFLIDLHYKVEQSLSCFYLLLDHFKGKWFKSGNTLSVKTIRAGVG